MDFTKFLNSLSTDNSDLKELYVRPRDHIHESLKDTFEEKIKDGLRIWRMTGISLDKVCHQPERL